VLTLWALLAVTAFAVAVYLLSAELLRHRAQAQDRGRLRQRLLGISTADSHASAHTSQANAGELNATLPDHRKLVSQLQNHRNPSWPVRLLAQLKGRSTQARQQAAYERELPAMLEVIALGMRAGMGFDQAFELYACRFDTALAQLCVGPLDVWQRGLITREAGMQELSEQVATPFFRRFTTTALRSLRFGAPMIQMLGDLAKESRKEYRAKREAMVAKAPVKMLLPTGALILPAMLLLVMGPIVLDLLGRLG
jgi:tight adherence protein C